MSTRPSSNFFGLRLQIDYVSIDQIVPASVRTRKHSKLKIKALCSSILAHGMLLPIRVNASGQVLGGHALLEAAKLLQMPSVPIVRIEHMTEEQQRLYSIAENKLTEGSTWDLDALAEELRQIAIKEPKIDLGRSAFSIAERDIIIGRQRTDDLTDLDDTLAQVPAANPVSRLGDLFYLGRHGVMCADARDPSAIAAACRGEQVRSFISDLPYNVPIAGHVSGLGANTHREFVMGSGELSQPQFTSLIAGAIEAAQTVLAAGALLYLFMDWRHMGELLEAADERSLQQLNLLVWQKANAGMGSFYRSAHELIGVFKHGTAPHINNVQLGRYGRSRTNVLHYPGVNSFGKGRNKALELHPTSKPCALIADLILDSSGEGDVILDTFGGSGTTLIAAEKMARQAALIELDPRYVDATIRRWQDLTGDTAILSTTGQTFADLSVERVASETADAA